MIFELESTSHVRIPVRIGQNWAFSNTHTRSLSARDLQQSIVSVNFCIPAGDGLHLSRSHPRANHRPMIWMDQLHARLSVVRRRSWWETAYCAPSVWLCVIALAFRYPSAACVHLSHLREGVAWVACLAGVDRVRACVRAYEDTPHRLAGG